MPDINIIEQRVSKLETGHAELRAGQASLAKEVDVEARVGALNARFGQFETKITSSIEHMAEGIKELGGQMGKLYEINDENMRNQGRQAQEAHEKQMALKDAQIAKMEQERENARLINKIKNTWTPYLQLIGALAIALGVGWAIFTFGVREALPEATNAAVVIKK
jgi:hypothetical protein